MTTYYLDGTNGLDSNDGLTVGGAKQTLAGATGLLAAGDRLEIRTGSYAGGENAWNPLGAGTDFSSGAITIIPYQSEVVTITAPAADHAVNLKETQHHIIFDGLHITASSGVYGVKMHYNGGDPPSVSAHHIRVQNCEIYNCYASGVGMDRSPTADSFQGGYNEFINCNIHNNGQSGFDHGLYISTPNNLVENCTISGNAGYGVQIDADDAVNNNNIVRNNLFFASADSGAGVVLSAGSGHLIYNNVFYGTGGGIFCDKAGSVFNNTFDVAGYVIYYYGAGSEVMAIQNNLTITSNFYCIYIESGSGVHTIQNNLTNGATIQGIKDTPGNSTISGNIDSAGYAFVNRAGRNYHILTSSTAKDAGLDLSAQGFSTDRDGISRPRGPAWDIGAYEFMETTAIRLAYSLG